MSAFKKKVTSFTFKKIGLNGRVQKVRRRWNADATLRSSLQPKTEEAGPLLEDVQMASGSGSHPFITSEDSAVGSSAGMNRVTAYMYTHSPCRQYMHNSNYISLLHNVSTTILLPVLQFYLFIYCQI
jgi:hypothetical protein